LSIRIIQGSSGPTTKEKILQLILASPQGITAKEICRTLNRPVSMVQICLKALKSSRKIYAKSDGAYRGASLELVSRACVARATAPRENRMQTIYYPCFRPERINSKDVE
jgi:hypothetical protein